eukprot:366000-Chlamydomonas_euryale.AAC.5
MLAWHDGWRTGGCYACVAVLIGDGCLAGWCAGWLAACIHGMAWWLAAENYIHLDCPKFYAHSQNLVALPSLLFVRRRVWAPQWCHDSYDFDVWSLRPAVLLLLRRRRRVG